MKLVDRWIEALRSGSYEQCTGTLYDGEGYCCLGVLTHLYDPDHPALQPKAEEFLPSEIISILLEEEPKAADFVDSDNIRLFRFDEESENDNELTECATELNDAWAWDFPSIADAIERTFRPNKAKKG